MTTFLEPGPRIAAVLIGPLLLIGTARCARPVDGPDHLTAEQVAAVVQSCYYTSGPLADSLREDRPVPIYAADPQDTWNRLHHLLFSRVTRRVMSSVALAVSWARSLTSPATTAKPLPASPARAASMVALSASRLVCSAIEVMIFTTLPISAEEERRRFLGEARYPDRAASLPAVVRRIGGDAPDFFLYHDVGFLLQDGGRLLAIERLLTEADTGTFIDGRSTVARILLQ